MVRALLIRGMLAGLIAGILIFGFNRMFGEPQIDRAIAFETALDAAKAKAHAEAGMPSEEPEPVLVSRQVQAGLGLFTGVGVYAAALGGLFALVFACAYGRIGDAGPRAVSAILGAAGFVAVSLVPYLKYPANPPAIGEPETIGYRTALYFVMIMISAAAMVAAFILRQRLVARSGGWSATLAAAAAYLLAMVAALYLLPTLDEVPAGFPATVLWNFRIVSLATQFILWTVIAVLFGHLAEHAMAARQRSLLQPSPAGRSVLG